MRPTPGLLVGGTRSGCGKTTVTLCLMAALERRGLLVQGFKVGPDFIDPSHHTACTGRPSYNLDSWMGQEKGLRAVWHRLRTGQPADILIGEGVMGLFDGADGLGGQGSTAHAALALHLPLLLVLDARGQGQSAAATALGFVRARPELRFVGAVCTHVGSASHQAMLREAFSQLLGEELPLLGLLPRENVPELPSRHLGLVMAHEQDWSPAQRDSMAQWLEAHMDVEALTRACPLLPAVAAVARPAPKAPPIPKARIGIARDEAFCFLYPDMPAVLAELGAECVFFSPLRHSALPEGCTALYFPGGYPELHAPQLTENTALREAVRAFAATGQRVYAECGGYMYLMQSVRVGEKSWPMCGCLPQSCTLGAHKAALGYREVRLAAGPDTLYARGHEFHYAHLNAEPAPTPLWSVHDRQGKPLAAEGCVHGSVWASWTHLYPEGAREMLARIFDLSP